MRNKIIVKLKNNKKVLRFAYNVLRAVLNTADFFIPKKKKILFASFGGRNFDDSPLALYNKLIGDERFNQYKMIWAFVTPDSQTLPKGEKIRIDSLRFFYELLSSKIWISNSGIDRGIELSRKRHISVETWHGTPIKKIGDDSNDKNALNENKLRKTDCETIRCAQSTYDLDIFTKVFNASRESFLLCDLPRNDRLLSFSEEEKSKIRGQLNIPDNKKIVLYMPTYREYLVSTEGEYYMTPPIDIDKWEKTLSKEYTVLFRAHYTIGKLLKVQDSDFIKDVSNYAPLDDLYIISDILISDYSSSFIDFSILNRPMICFPYDYETYVSERGLYIDLKDDFSGEICFDEDTLLKKLTTLDVAKSVEKTKEIHSKYAPYAGDACNAVINTVYERLNQKNETCN